MAKKRLVGKAESEENILCKCLDGKALFTGMLQLYTATSREMEDSLLPECAQGKEEAEPHRKRRKEIATLTTVTASVRRRRQKNVDHYPSTKSHGQW
jgi:hypothetical protein